MCVTGTYQRRQTISSLGSWKNAAIMKPRSQRVSGLVIVTEDSRHEIAKPVMLPSTPPTRTQKKPNRTPALIALSICTFFLFAVIFAQATFKLTFLQPDTSEETLIFAALSALIFLLFLALTFVLIRTLLRTLCRTQDGHVRLEDSQPHGDGRLAAVVGACHFPLSVFLWTTQPFHREVVFTSGRRRANTAPT